MNAHYLEWANLLVRWVHMTVGIAWIGASFYFNWLENNLNRKFGLRDELAGNLWAVHGGGFYYLEKYKNAPQEIPPHLHWFKWEAYFTWLSGFLLLCLVYYLSPSSFLLDPAKPNIAGGTAIMIGLGTLIGGWIVYDQLCRSKLILFPRALSAILFCLMAGAAYGLQSVLSARAAYMHIGAMVGTIMAANVFFVIIPSQKAMVDAAKRREPLDPRLGKSALGRSRHNNYLTLPVLFVMISSHFPSTYGSGNGPGILCLLFLIGILVRHYFNIRKESNRAFLILPAAFIAFWTLAALSKPAEESLEAGKATPSFTQVSSIIYTRCSQCHSAMPTDDVFKAPPSGVVYDTPAQIQALAPRIKERSVIQHTMPLGNKTGITEEEREILGRWVDAGAKIN